MKQAFVVTQGPGTEALANVYASAREALRAGHKVFVFADVDGVKAMRGTNDLDGHDLSALQSLGATVTLCRLCVMRQGLDLDPLVVATARTGDIDDLSRMLAESGGDGCDSNMRHIVVSLSAALGENEPDRTTEGLRAAVGLVRSTECHDVEIVLEGGASAALASTAPEIVAMLTQLRAAGVPLFEAAADGGGADETEKVEPASLEALLAEADVLLRY